MTTLVISFPETKHLAEKVARGLKAEYATLSSTRFPDYEVKLSLDKNPRGKKVIIISSMAHEPDYKLVRTLLAGGIARDYGAKEVILVATYFPYLRQDRHFFEYDSFSSKHITRLFSEFDKVITIDPHLHRIKNLKILAKNFSHITTNPLIAKYIKKRFKDKFVIVGPDEESSQWSDPVAKILGRKVVVIKKHRYSPSKIRDEKTKASLGRNVIIIDDIISTGKTMAGAVELARKKGAKNIIAIGIHGVLAGDSVKLIRKHAELITTNTIPSRFSKIDISDVIIDKLKK